MRRVSKTRIVWTRVLALAAILSGGTLLAQEPPLIDLVSEPARAGQQRPVTFTFGGVAFHNPKPIPELPLQVLLESIAPSKEIPNVKVVQVLIKNIGTEPYPLPVGRDGDAALRPANRGRHEFWFGLKAPRERQPYLPGKQTYSSADLPGSVMLIPPNGTVRVRYSVYVNPSGRDWKGDDQGHVVVKASCEDLSYDDSPSKYVVHTPNPKAVSGNEMTISLK
ncbi:MAG: hypothetical protein ABFD89_25205 [Bryobacteraceae bacterium]